MIVIYLRKYLRNIFLGQLTETDYSFTGFVKYIYLFDLLAILQKPTHLQAWKELAPENIIDLLHFVEIIITTDIAT